MTSPRQRKKRLRLKLANEKQETTLEVEVVEPTKSVVAVATPPVSVVESPSTFKTKKSRNALVETKPQDQVVEQPKVEVNTETKE